MGLTPVLAALLLGNLAERLEAGIPPLMEEQGVACLVAVVVDRDQTLYAGGFGVADPENGSPPDPDRTTFRVASVTKLFTATAAMQMVERGQVPLDEDLNLYLEGVQVPEAFGEPVSLRHLLTHTAGLGARFLGSRARTRERQLPLDAYLAGHLPRRFIPPGQVFSYANHGMALAGQVVASVDGRPFHEYLREELLLPLGMRSSGVGMEPELVERLAVARIQIGGEWIQIPVDYRNEVPSGSLITTGADMARFLRANLRGGEVDGVRILQPETVDAMHSLQHSPHPRLGGVGFGFLHRRLDTWPFIGHDGDITGWNARAWIQKGSGIGVFLAYTGTDTTKGFADRVTRLIFEPAPAPPALPRLPRRVPKRGELEAYTGVYRWTRQVRDGVEKLVVPYHFVEFSVAPVGTDGLEIASTLGAFPTRRYRAAEGEHLFESEDDGEVAAFRVDSMGRPTHLLLSRGVLMALEPVPGYATALVRLAVYAAFLVAFAGTALVLGARALGTRRGVGAWGAVVCAGYAAFLVAIPVALGIDMFVTDVTQPPRALLGSGVASFFYGLPPSAKSLLLIPPLGLGASAVLAARALLWPAHGRALPVGLLVASVAFALYLGSWDLFPGL